MYTNFLQGSAAIGDFDEHSDADFVVVSCITCLMHLDDVQKELSEGNGRYALPVFDYSQLLALCMGFPAGEVAAISTTPRRVLESKNPGVTTFPVASTTVAPTGVTGAIRPINVTGMISIGISHSMQSIRFWQESSL